MARKVNTVKKKSYQEDAVIKLLEQYLNSGNWPERELADRILNKRMSPNFRELKYGFGFGAMEVERVYSDPKGYNVVVIRTPREELQICSTKAGRLTVKSFKIVKTKDKKKVRILDTSK